MTTSRTRRLAVDVVPSAVTQTTLTYSSADLERWKRKDRSLLRGCQPLVRRLLTAKADTRPGRRFFGKAYVLANEGTGESWYGSFKWLTSPKWSAPGPLADDYQEAFRAALQRHFRNLDTFQQEVRAAAEKTAGSLPVGPDLWLVTRRRHRFIEVKLPGDSLASHQLEGLQLIERHLRAADGRLVSVEVVTLSPREAIGS